MYSRRGHINLAYLKLSQTLPCIFSKHCYRNSGEHRWVTIQTAQRGLQEQSSAQVVVPLKVMECRRHLNQALQECFLRLESFQPHTFPFFVGGKELARFIQMQSFRQRPSTPIENHGQRWHDPS